MACYVQKFGGTSVGNLERIQHVAQLIDKTYREGNQLVVVLSAMSGETDRLMKMAKELSTRILMIGSWMFCSRQVSVSR